MAEVLPPLHSLRVDGIYKNKKQALKNRLEAKLREEALRRRVERLTKE